MSDVAGNLWFVTGGARSGKSRYAERLAAGSGRAVVYIATMHAASDPPDEELERRIARHRAERPADWTTIEAPLDPAAALAGADRAACAILDCLSLWVTNRLLALGDAPPLDAVDALEATLSAELIALLDTAATRDGPTILVTNEVGGGVVPAHPQARAFRDLLGRVNQQAAARAGRAWLLVAGRPLPLPPHAGE